jgi:nucleoside-diphosphate-sugar epimerase
MRCLVTGASGFLGSHLVRQLLVEGHEVIALMRESSQPHRVSDWIDQVRLVRGTLEDVPAISLKLADDSFDVCFHLAWFGVTAEYRNDPAQIATNVVGTLNLWKLAREKGCRHWIGLGSQAEYGPSDAVLHENLIARPATAYGVAKLASGMLTEKMSEMAGMLHTWVRLLAVYGPGDDPKHLIPAVIETLLAGNRPALTRGEQRWDYLYVVDAARALCRVAETKAVGTMNLACGETVILRDLVTRIRDMIDPRLPIGFGDIPYRPDQVMHLEADITRLRAATGWKPQTSLEEGLRRTVEWFRNEYSHAN